MFINQKQTRIDELEQEQRRALAQVEKVQRELADARTAESLAMQAEIKQKQQQLEESKKRIGQLENELKLANAEAVTQRNAKETIEASFAEYRQRTSALMAEMQAQLQAERENFQRAERIRNVVQALQEAEPPINDNNHDSNLGADIASSVNPSFSSSPGTCGQQNDTPPPPLKPVQKEEPRDEADEELHQQQQTPLTTSNNKAMVAQKQQNHQQKRIIKKEKAVDFPPIRWEKTRKSGGQAALVDAPCGRRIYRFTHKECRRWRCSTCEQLKKKKMPGTIMTVTIVDGRLVTDPFAGHMPGCRGI